MHKLKLDPEVDMWVSGEILADCSGNTEVLQFSLYNFLGTLGADERTYVDLYGQVHNKERIACLNAHGSDEDGVWYYSDDMKRKPVQGWINSLKGRYKLVVLFVCNTGAHTPVCKRSLLLLPDANLSFLALKAGSCNFTLIHPTEGELEYTLDYELKKLQAKLKEKKK